MPLHVEIRVNSALISKIHIGRIEGGTEPDNVNKYIALVGEEPLRMDDWLERGVEFQHRYGDGAEVCVRKALQALEVEGKFDEA